MPKFLKTLKTLQTHFSIRKKIQAERKSRLQKTPSLPLKSSNLLKTRNIGTIAHIDAGKTTLTERMLYFSGALPHMGEVHHGTAFMDYLEEEQKRGITITSACITFSWKGHHINLIDTPGHADFNFEVERALRVLDGAIVIVDGVKGVEAQTETVWRQAARFLLPKILVVNKLDRVGAEFFESLVEVRKRFGILCLPVFLPVYQREVFQGVLDVFGQEFCFWSEVDGEKVYDSRKVVFQEFEEEVRERYCEVMDLIVESVSEENGDLLDEYLEKDPFCLGDEFLGKLKNGVRLLVNKYPNNYCLATPISALKNKGVTQVLDILIENLPQPKNIFKNEKTPFLFCFKSIEDPEYGKIIFTRILNGNIKINSVLKNFRNSENITITSIFRVRANEFVEIEKAETGDIIGIQTNSIIENGDNLFEDSHEAKNYLMKGFDNIEPLFFASIELENNKDKKKFLEAVKKYIRDDPSLKFEDNKETGQFLLKGLGELHLEIVLSQIRKEKKINLKIGKTIVAFKEMVKGDYEQKISIERDFNKKFKFLDLDVSVEMVDFEDGENFQDPSVEMDLWPENINIKKLFEEYCHIKTSKFPKKSESENESEVEGQITTQYIENPLEEKPYKTNHKFSNGLISDLHKLETLSFAKLYEIKKNIENLFTRGPIMYSPLINTKVKITSGFYNPKFLDEIVLKMIGNEVYQNLLNKKNTNLLEPFVKVFVSTNSKFSNLVINEAVNNKGGRVGEIDGEAGVSKLEVFIPLLSVNDFTNFLRTVTSGEVEFSMENAGFFRVGSDRQKFLIKTNA